MRTQRDLFPADLGLVVRMVAVGLMTPVLVIAALVGVVEWAPWKVIAVVFGSLLVGAVVGMQERVKVSSRGRRVSPAEAPELHAVVERLCVLADLSKPELRRVTPGRPRGPASTT